MRATTWRKLSYCLLATAFFIGFFNRFAQATFLKPISQTFELGAAGIGGFAATHFWVYTLMQIPAGIIVDRFGIRAPATVGTLLMSVGAFSLGLAPSYTVALAGPFFVGFGMSIVFVATMKNNAIWFDGRHFGFVTGCTLLIGSLGSIVAEAPAYALLRMVEWRSVFIGLGSATLFVSVSIALLWRSPEAVNRQAAPSAPLQSGSNLTQTKAWLEAARKPQVWLILVAISGTNGTFYAFAGLWGTRFLSDGFGLPTSTASWIITWALVPYGLGSLLVGHFSDWLHNRKAFVFLASLFSAVAWAWLLLGPWTGAATGLACFVALGLSSAQVAVSFAAVKESVSEDIIGVALALVNMGVFLTTAVVQMGYGWLISWAYTNSTAP
ncbi:MAG: MFS transporter, partial [Nitrosospira sp.]|nr:MFS transporter [Nitrosospira sp.]